jgi:ABC-2 type transport system ATP-binding protein
MSATMSDLSLVTHESVVVCDGLTVRYGERRVVDDLHFVVPRGAVYALLGRNGAGKSSIIRCLLGLTRPTGGSVRLFGDDVWSERAALMTRVGVVPEEPDAPPAMTVRELARFCQSVYQRWDQPALVARLARFGVPLDVTFAALSKGQKTQTALGLALAAGPELLVLDDPTLGMDHVARRELYGELIGELADRGTTVVLTTHELSEVEGIASHVGILRDGRLVIDEPLESLKARVRQIRYAHGPADLAAALAPLQPLAVRSDRHGVEAVVGRYAPGTFDQLRRGSRLQEAEVLPLSLADIFAAVVQEQPGGDA